MHVAALPAQPQSSLQPMMPSLPVSTDQGSSPEHMHPEGTEMPVEDSQLPSQGDPTGAPEPALAPAGAPEPALAQADPLLEQMKELTAAVQT